MSPVVWAEPVMWEWLGWGYTAHITQGAVAKLSPRLSSSDDLTGEDLVKELVLNYLRRLQATSLVIVMVLHSSWLIQSG